MLERVAREMRRVEVQSKNVALPSTALGDVVGTPPGTWCFVLEGGIDPSTATVITSAVATEDERSSAISAEWEPYARDCATGQIEIKTFVDTVKEGLEFSGATGRGSHPLPASRYSRETGSRSNNPTATSVET
jgi:hypothetical protein